MNDITIAQSDTTLRRQIRFLLMVLIIGLVLSGLTAFPIAWQLNIAHRWIQENHSDNVLTRWIEFVHKGVTDSYSRYPFIAYGTDWLAFAHLMIAVAFVGPLRYPVKNIWVIEFGIIASIGIFPLALIAGTVRGIPFYWQLIDCSFGLVAGAILVVCYKKVKQLERNSD